MLLFSQHTKQLFYPIFIDVSLYLHAFTPPVPLLFIFSRMNLLGFRYDNVSFNAYVYA